MKTLKEKEFDKEKDLDEEAAKHCIEYFNEKFVSWGNKIFFLKVKKTERLNPYVVMVLDFTFYDADFVEDTYAWSARSIDVIKFHVKVIE